MFSEQECPQRMQREWGSRFSPGRKTPRWKNTSEPPGGQANPYSFSGMYFRTCILSVGTGTPPGSVGVEVSVESLDDSALAPLDLDPMLLGNG